MGKMVSPPFLSHFDRIFAKLAGIQDMRKSSDELKMQPGWIIHVSVTRPWTLEKILTD